MQCNQASKEIHHAFVAYTEISSIESNAGLKTKLSVRIR
jgi:hypothetical protein